MPTSSLQFLSADTRHEQQGNTSPHKPCPSHLSAARSETLGSRSDELEICRRVRRETGLYLLDTRHCERSLLTPKWHSFIDKQPREGPSTGCQEQRSGIDNDSFRKGSLVSVDLLRIKWKVRQQADMSHRDKLPIVADILKHPAFPTATWNLEPTRNGLLPVAEGRGGPLRISWEIHGSGPIKIIVRERPFIHNPVISPPQIPNPDTFWRSVA